MENEKTTVDIEEVVKQEEQEKAAKAPEKAEDAKPEPAAIDYDKLEKILSGRKAATEDSVLKGYFKQQGMEPDEMKAAIEAYKQRQAEATPDVGAIQAQMQTQMAQATQQIEQANQRAIAAEMQAKAMLMASELGVDTKSMPFIIRAANLAEVAPNGEINEGKLRTSLEEVIDAIPALKKTAQSGGFEKVGAEINGGATQADDDALARAFGVKK